MSGGDFPGQNLPEKLEIVDSTTSGTMAEYATIQVRRTTKRMLEAARQPGETFDALVRRKLKEAQAAEERAFLREVNRLLADRKAMKPLR